MEKESMLDVKPNAVFIDTVVTVCKMMTYDDFVNMVKDMPHVNVNCNQEVDGGVGYSVTTYRNGVESEPVKWTTSPTGATVGRTGGLAFSEALSASRLGMFVARKAWDESGIAMHPIDAAWPIETKGLPPIWCRTKNKCNMSLNLNVPDFIANDWYIVDERPAKVHHFGFADFTSELQEHAREMIEKKKPVQLPLNYSRKTPLVPLESQLGYPGKDATENLTLDQRLNERARIQRESGM